MRDQRELCAAAAAREALWAEWALGVISVADDTGELVDVNGPRATRGLPLTAPFHVVTAYEPFGHALGAAATSAAAARLAEEVERSGLPHRRASGHSADWSHEEPSIAVAGLSRDEAKALGARYLQEAVYEVTEDHVAVVACTHDRVVVVARVAAPR
jgi:hypothetical protein